MITTYKNSFYKKGDNYNTEHITTHAKSIAYKGYAIYHRIKSANRSADCFDIVKDGVCIGMMAGLNGAKERIDNFTDNRLFAGKYSAGIVYADKKVPFGRDYKKIAFMPYNTLELRFYKCPDELKQEIINDALTYKRGDKLQISTCGQTVILGEG